LLTNRLPLSGFQLWRQGLTAGARQSVAFACRAGAPKLRQCPSSSPPREASYLASVYPQVHLDFGLVVPKLSVRGMRCAVSDLMDLAPLNKIMFSTDGYAFPETFYLGAKWSREILSRVLIEAYDNGDMPINEALAAADGILGRNALDFYKLEGRGGFSASTDSLSKLNQAATAGYAASVASMDRTASFQPRLPPSLRTLPNSKSIKLDSASQLASPRAPKVDILDEKVIDPIVVVEKDMHEGILVKHVRLLFSDGSGQRRCRVSAVKYLHVSDFRFFCASSMLVMF
jgi:hypothetical protein